MTVEIAESFFDLIQTELDNRNKSYGVMANRIEIFREFEMDFFQRNQLFIRELASWDKCSQFVEFIVNPEQKQHIAKNLREKMHKCVLKVKWKKLTFLISKVWYRTVVLSVVHFLLDIISFRFVHSRNSFLSWKTRFHMYGNAVS